VENSPRILQLKQDNQQRAVLVSRMTPAMASWLGYEDAPPMLPKPFGSMLEPAIADCNFAVPTGKWCQAM
jgi:hypothetical protein